MREKLLDLMKNEGLKPSQLAEMLEINPAGVSHILAGRNKPGFDLLQKILRRFPQINPDWLLLDSPKMYRDAPAAETPRLPNRLAGAPASGGNLFEPTAPSAPVQNDNTATAERNPANSIITTKEIAALKGAMDANVERVVLFYDDHTFEHFILKHK